jgi:ion channel-forming bestrophin family protein
VVVAVLAYGVYTVGGVATVALSFAPLAVLGTALSIFLAFRANTSFARWGEAAQLWANIISSSRIFARLICTFVDSHSHTSNYNAEYADAFKRAMIYRHLAWANALRIQLRKQDAWAEAGKFLDDSERQLLETKQNKTGYLLKLQGAQIYGAMASGTLQGFDSFQLEGQLALLSNYQAACERIKLIPVPRQYDYFTRLFVRLFVIVTPFFLLKTLVADGAPWLVIPLSGLIAFLFTAIERTGAVNEEPFENRITDVPLSAYCRDIERDLFEILGEDNLPPKLEPKNGYLW